MRFRRHLLSIWIALAWLILSLQAQPGAALVTNPSYHLAIGDTISVSVKDEPELALTQVVEKAGTIRLSLVGDFQLAGKAVRDAEAEIAKSYRDNELLRAADVHIQVIEYAPRFVSVLGAVRNPGKIAFPRDLQQLDILDALAQAGGILPIGKPDAVSLIRTSPDGREVMISVDVAKMTGIKRKDERVLAVSVYPGDRIVVPERLF